MNRTRKQSGASKRGASKSSHSKSKKSYEVVDAYTTRAHREGYVARSVYKLIEIDEKHSILKPGMKVLDLGCAPGSWLQYASKKIGPRGQAVGVDIANVRVELTNVTILKQSLFDLHLKSEPWNTLAPFDLIQSDAMSKTSGVGEADTQRSLELVLHSLELAATGFLKVGGTFLAKIFEGSGFGELVHQVKQQYEQVHVLKPQAVRPGSRELYVLGLGLKKIQSLDIPIAWRPATMADARAIADLATRIWRDHYTDIIGPKQVDYMLREFQSEAAISKQIQRKELDYQIVHQGDRAVGYFATAIRGQNLFLSKLYLDRPVRGKKIARQIVEALAEQARNLNLSAIELTVNKYNTNTVAAYKKMEFEIVEDIVIDIGNGYVMDDHRMIKPIK